MLDTHTAASDQPAMGKPNWNAVWYICAAMNDLRSKPNVTRLSHRVQGFRHIAVTMPLLTALSIVTQTGCADEEAAKAAVKAHVTCPAGTSQKGQLPPEGRLLWCERDDGVRHGPWVSAWDDDDKSRASRGEYREGVRLGPYESWYPGGHTAAATLDRPVGDGVMTVTNELGKTLYTIPHTNGATSATLVETKYADGVVEGRYWTVGEGDDVKKHGWFEAFHPDGSPWIEGEYLNGKRHGHWVTSARGAK